MSRVLIIGAGLAGLTAAVVLARDGHAVTVLERDTATPSATWRRPGAPQFQHVHLNLADWLHSAEAELPELPERLLAAGGLRINLLNANPALKPDDWLPADKRFETITARRPVLEQVLAELARETPGVDIRRGINVTGLLLDSSAAGPRVTGVQSTNGSWQADLVVDASGRRSALPRWLRDEDLPAPTEWQAKAGTTYYSRHFRSHDGSVPELLAGTLQLHDGVSIITLPADNGTWSVALLTGDDDLQLRQLRDPDTWMQALSMYPVASHWADGEPLDGKVHMLAALHDRKRSLMRNGTALVRNLVLLGDAWACTDPSLGRGSSLTFRHAVLLRDALREHDSDSDPDFTSRFESQSEQELGPILKRSWWFIGNRLAEMQADRNGKAADLGEDWASTQAGRRLEVTDAELARGFAGVAYLLQSTEEAYSDDTSLLDKRIAQVLAGEWQPYPLPGPTHAELLTRLAGSK